MKWNFLKINRIEGLVWLFLGVSLCVGAIKLGLGGFHKPGAGLVPFLSGALLGLLGLILMFSPFLNGSSGNERVRLNWKFVLLLLMLFFYLIFLEPLGFLLTTFLFLFFLFEITEPKKWVMSLILSGVTATLGYLVFSVWLEGQFPKGILAF